MREYDMPIEEQVKSLSKDVRALSEATRELGEAMRAGFDAVDKRFDAVDKRFDGVGKRFDGVDKRFDTIETKLDTIQIRLEDTHAVATLGLEGIEALRESTDEKFAEAAKVNSAQTALLKTLFVHVRKRVEVVERKAADRPKARRRS